jgi:hypothetical protein
MPCRLRLVPPDDTDDELAAMTQLQRNRHVHCLRQWRAIQWTAELNAQAQMIVAAAAINAGAAPTAAINNMAIVD